MSVTNPVEFNALYSPNELYHHGILGMKWGKKNGPPYPLDYSKLSSEEKSAAKEKAIRQGNIKEARSNIDEFTDQELRAVKERFKLNQEVKMLADADIKTGKKKANELASTFETTARLTNGVANTAVNGIKIYNALGAIGARANGTTFTPINTGGGKKKKKGGNDDD